MQDHPKQLPVKSREGIVYATVDTADYLWASAYNWHLINGYAVRQQRRGQGRKLVRISLAREILGLKHTGREVGVADHINGVQLDNRRCNLRVVTMAQNAQNRKANCNGSSRHKGVSWYARKNCWRVAIMLNGKRKLIGYFDDEEEAGVAAAAYYAVNSPYNRQGPSTAS